MAIEDVVEGALMGCRRVAIFVGAGIDEAVPVLDPQWANADAFYHHPQEAYAQYARLVDPPRRPNWVHRLLQRLQRHATTLVVTLNIDGVETRSLANVVALFGDVTLGKCTQWECLYRGPMAGQCPRCGGVLRPAVVWEGESFSLLDLDTIDDFLMEGVDLTLCIGTAPWQWPLNAFITSAKWPTKQAG